MNTSLKINPEQSIAANFMFGAFEALAETVQSIFRLNLAMKLHKYACLLASNVSVYVASCLLSLRVVDWQ